MWWPRYQEHSLLGLTTTTPSTSSKKTKRQLKKKTALTFLNQSYDCFVNGSDSVDVDNAIVPIVYAFLHAFDACFDEYVQVPLIP